MSGRSSELIGVSPDIARGLIDDSNVAVPASVKRRYCWDGSFLSFDVRSALAAHQGKRCFP
jgi:hypothetical protein